MVANKLPVKYDAREIGTPTEEKSYMWKQSDYVPSGLHIWRPVSAAEAAQLPEATQIVPFGKGPNPEEALMPQGAKGIPGAEGAPEPEKIANARVPVYVHPDIAPHLEPMLETTTPKNALIKALLKASSEAKSDLLSLSPFHWGTIMMRTLEAHATDLATSPFKTTKAIFAPKDVDYYNLTPAQSAALRDGVVVSSTRPGFSGYLDEGLASEGHSVLDHQQDSADRRFQSRDRGEALWTARLDYFAQARPVRQAEDRDSEVAAEPERRTGRAHRGIAGEQ